MCTVPRVVKLSPQAESIPDMCKAVEAAGADGISLCNTFQACAIDLEKRRPVFNNTFAGLSGPAIRPIALRDVYKRQAHGLFQFYGANRTGRWSSRMIQLQNLPQNHRKDLDLARSIVEKGDLSLIHI